MLSTFIKKHILKTFLQIELSSSEQNAAEESIAHKYAVGIRRAIFFSVLSILPILFLDTSIIVSVLIPITMVSGTAWFAVSLANMKQKFERFGLELTQNLFESFVISLGLLFTLSLFSLSSFLWQDTVQHVPQQLIWQSISVIIGTWVVGNMIYKIFIGSIKYDINDTMLTGQNEAAERFFRKSLSILHSVATSLRTGKSLQVANYYIGVAFFEVFSYLEQILPDGTIIPELLQKSNQLVKTPSMDQAKADHITYELINIFTSYVQNPVGFQSKKSLQAIRDELECIEKNTDESQEMSDTRFAIIFEEIANLLEGQGETLFIH